MIPPGTLTYLRSPALKPLWSAAHRRLAHNGRAATGRLTLTGLDAEQRDAIGHLINRPLSARCVVDLADLDRRLSASAAETGLLGVVEAVTGPVPDRRADASVEAGRRSQLRDHAQAALTAAGLGDREWAATWMDRLWRQGLPAKLPTGDFRRLVAQAATALGLTVGAQARLWSRGELAQAVTGSAHGLDDDTTLNRLVLRGLALALTGSPDYPASAEGRRSLWDQAGVANDSVATTVLTYGLRPIGVDWLHDRADLRAETHLTLREIRRLGTLRLKPQTVYVCENPRVLEALADAALDVPAICTMGNPTTVTLALLDTVTQSAGVRLAYHGDFDWPGIAIAGRIFDRYPAEPWHFRAHDYRRAVALAAERGTPHQPLAGRAAPTVWDPDLAVAMASAGVAIHEEAVLDGLIASLRNATL
ncbi:TIGR02679 family protein [Actinoplanes sp. GCM10030250]|uniref:TIGR02679 family protein n=1 Tax=Actinoplanes sp. GCM10030250 TaxID=3273376 RepID=UPI00361D7B9F